MKIGFKGYNENVLTFEVSSKIEPGTPVKSAAGGKVTSSGVGENFIGIVKACDNKYATVIVSGAVTVSCDDDSATYGMSGISADGTGGVTVNDEAVFRAILDFDTTAGTITFLL